MAVRDRTKLESTLDLGKRIERALRTGLRTEFDPANHEVLDVQPLAAGGAEAAKVHFVDGSRAFAKRYLGPDGANRLQGEVEGLLALGDVLPASASGEFRLVAPRVLRADREQGLLLCEWIDTTSTRRNERAFAEALVSMQQQSHRVGPDDVGFQTTTYLGATAQDNQPTDDWADFFVGRRLQAMLRFLESVAPRRLVTDLERLCAAAPEILRESDEANVILHGDLWSGNLLWTDRGAALIDPAAYWGHREAELGMLTLFGGLGTHFYERYREIWPLERGWRRRVAVYRLYHVLNHRVLFGSSYDESARRLLSELLSGSGS